jgi:hypothetical protein
MMSDMEIGDWLVFDNMGAFAMTHWDGNYSINDSQDISQNGAHLVAENFW